MMLLSYVRLREFGRRPRLHPNGFIQLDLTKWGNLRLHVWPDEPVPAQKTSHPIHDHSFDMESTVILGTLTNREFKFVLGQAPEGRTVVYYRLFQATRLAGQDTVLAEVDGLPGYLQPTKAKDLTPGERYKLGRGILHESTPHGLTATIMEKINPDPEYGPLVAVPEGVQPDNDFRRETIDEELLWSFIRRALEESNVVQPK